jgi:hypothetical protein
MGLGIKSNPTPGIGGDNHKAVMPNNQAERTLHELAEALMYGDIIIERIPYRDSEDMPFWTYRAHFDGESVTEAVERDTVEAAIREVYEARAE